MYLDLWILLLSFLLIILFGFLQKTPGDRYAIITLVLFLVTASYIVFYLAYDYRFDVLAFFFGCVIALHHMCIHRESDFTGQITCCTLQLHDISNHETWIVACVTAAIVWFYSYTPCTY